MKGLRKKFGYIELILGIILIIILVIGNTFFIIKLNDNLNKFSQFYSGSESRSETYLFSFSILGFIFIYFGFNIVIFILSVILILQGILDIRGE